MNFKTPVLAVNDIAKSKKFYSDTLGLEVIADFGANVTLTGGIALQTKDTWMDFIHKKEDEIIFGNNATELYFEEDDFTSFIQRLTARKDINYVHPPFEHRWGQRVVRFYDIDRHIIEVGETMLMVVRRFLKSGLSIEETALRMDVPVAYIQSCIL